MIIYLARLAPNARRAAVDPERFRGPLQPDVMRRYPRIKPRISPGQADRLPFLCSVLHRMGFFLPRRLRVER